MAQFRVYRNQNPDTVNSIPFLVDVQNDLLETLQTRVVIPLYLRDGFSTPACQLNPCLKVEGLSLVLVTQELAGVPVKILGPEVADLQYLRDEIVAALDLLITGF